MREAAAKGGAFDAPTLKLAGNLLSTSAVKWAPYVMSFLGTQPTFTQVPPRGAHSATATLAPWVPAILAVRTPPLRKNVLQIQQQSQRQGMWIKTQHNTHGLQRGPEQDVWQEHDV